MKFIVDKSYWNLFPDSKLGVLLLKNMQNGESTDEIKSILKEANNEAKKYLTKEILSENPIIAVWREAYKKFKTKKGVRSVSYTHLDVYKRQGKNKARVAHTNADWFNIRGEKEDRRGNVKFDLNLGLDNQRYGVTAVSYTHLGSDTTNSDTTNSYIKFTNTKY